MFQLYKTWTSECRNVVVAVVMVVVVEGKQY